MLPFKTVFLIFLVAQWAEAGFFTQAQLVELLEFYGVIKSKRIKKVLLEVDRGKYIPENAYERIPIPLGWGATFSPMHMHALALETLNDHLKEGSKVLDIGSASGYLSVCMALMVGKSGYVIGLDHIMQLILAATKCLVKDRPMLFFTKRVRFACGDGRMGYADHGPYEAIHVGAVTEINIAYKLAEQLREGGRLIAPVNRRINEEDYCEFVILEKLDNGTLTRMDNATSFLETKIEKLTDRIVQLVEWSKSIPVSEFGL